MPTVLMTGASSGIGHATAERLLRLGWTVIGLARRAEAVPRGVLPVAVDLADPGAIELAFSRPPLAGARIDALVHSAGYGDFAPVEVTTGDAARRQLEVNVIAGVDLARRLLPAMRERRAGRLVFVSSIAAGFSSPMAGWYHASKAALEAVADALRQEVAGFGVEVALVRPGVVRTAWHATAHDRLAERVAGTAYEAMGQATAAYHATSAGSPAAADVGEVVAAIERALTDDRPRTRYPVGRGARTGSLLPHLVPDRTFDRLVRAQFGLGPLSDGGRPGRRRCHTAAAATVDS